MSIFGDLTSWVTDVVERLGYLGVAFLVALENVFPPIPSEIILPLAGFLTGEGKFNFFLMVLAATCGAVIGALILYYVAAWFGEHRIRALTRRYGKWFQITEKDLDRADEWFDKYGHYAVLLGRCAPIIRSIVSLPAGLRRMPLVPFITYTAAGATVWNVVLIGAGYLLGNNWDDVEQYVGYFQYVVIAAIVIAAGWFFFSRVVRRGNKAEVNERSSMNAE